MAWYGGNLEHNECSWKQRNLKITRPNARPSRESDHIVESHGLRGASEIYEHGCHKNSRLFEASTSVLVNVSGATVTIILSFQRNFWDLSISIKTLLQI